MKYVLSLLAFIVFFPTLLFAEDDFMEKLNKATTAEEEEKLFEEANKECAKELRNVSYVKEILDDLKKYKSVDEKAFLCDEGFPGWYELFGENDKYIIMRCDIYLMKPSYEAGVYEPVSYDCGSSYGGFRIWKKNSKGLYELLGELNLPGAYNKYDTFDSYFTFVKNKNYFTLESEGSPMSYKLYYTFKEVNDNIYLDRISQETYEPNEDEPSSVDVFYKYKKGEKRIDIKSLSDELIQELTEGINDGMSNY